MAGKVGMGEGGQPPASAQRERRGRKKKSLEMSGSLHSANRNEADCQSASIVSTVNPAGVSADNRQHRRSNKKMGTF